MQFRDRHEAGQFLAYKLAHYRGTPNLLVLALPRGGVPVAFEVAKALDAPLDILLVRKLGLPGREELAMGAIAAGGVRVLDDELVERLGVSAETIERVVDHEQRELERQLAVYQRGRAPPSVEGRTIILVDDGLATGATMRAAVRALRQRRPRRLVVAVPVGALETCVDFSHEVDEVVCAIHPREFLAVGVWYRDFSPTSDVSVQALLEEAARSRRETMGVVAAKQG